MSENWGNLPKNEQESIAMGARRLSEAEIEERFAVTDDDVVVFRVQRKTDKAMAGTLDIDVDEAVDEAERAALEEMAPEVEPSDVEIVEIALISPEDFDYEPELSDEDAEAAKPIDAVMADVVDYYREDTALETASAAMEYEADMAGLPSIIDRRAQQSPVKDQAGRGTCVAHASMGVLEAFAHIPDDLSEQYTHYKFNEFSGRPHNVNSGLRTTDAAPYLARGDGRICLEAEWPYIPSQWTINTMVANGTYNVPQAAQDNQTYGIGAYKIITDNGLTGESIKNTRYLEALVYQGYNVVIGTWVSWDDNNNDGILDPVLDPNGNPIGRGGHAMLIVGYNRNEQYFIVKNSWSAGWGHSGYAYLHYNLARSCFKYGYVVESVVPPAPTRLPKRLARAPYRTNRISRAQLRAAILFLKTSRRRYAICEAYAGYNLLLRNLRVYNADGTLHLERDSLLIRGTYLCDIDSARQTSNDADFWWQAVSPGVNYLVPRNNAAAYVAFDLAAVSATQIGGMSLSTAAVASRNLDYAVIVGRTTANRRYKMLVHFKSSNRVQLSYLELYNASGSRYRYATNLFVPSSWTYNLDTLRTGGGQYADIWNHVISDNVGFLERYSSARMRLLWYLW